MTRGNPIRFAKLFYLLCILSLSITFAARAESPVWKIEKNGHYLYIGGTIHLLTASDYPLPLAFETAYQQSVEVVLETDLEKLQSPEFQQTLLRELSYVEGQNLRQVLQEDTYQSLEEFFAARGIDMVDMVKFKPGMVAVTMTMVELQRLGLAGIGVDAYYSSKSVNDRKKLGKLESVNTQIAFIANMGAGREDEMFRYTLADIEQLPTMLGAMKEAWRKGDMTRLTEIGITPFKSEFPQMYNAMLVERNNAWIPQIESMLSTEGVELILVGALHLAGKDGLLEKLAAKNYKIRQLD
jgi:uncharacterized protein YbaP (TraB family)